jgi:hypothetical protein
LSSKRNEFQKKRGAERNECQKRVLKKLVPKKRAPKKRQHAELFVTDNCQPVPADGANRNKSDPTANANAASDLLASRLVAAITVNAAVLAAFLSSENDRSKGAGHESADGHHVPRPAGQYRA